VSEPSHGGRRSSIIWIAAKDGAVGISWYAIPSAFSLIASSFNENVSGLGLLGTAFFLGIGISQVPVGLLTARVGPTKILLLGSFLSSFSSLASGLAPTLGYIVLARFAFGVGMGFIFIPGLTLTATYSKAGSEGFNTGLYIGSFWVGGIVGIFGWGLLAGVIGWRYSLLISGAIDLVTSVMLVAFLPRDEITKGFRITIPDLRKLFLNNSLIILAVAYGSTQVGLLLSGYFTVYYLQNGLNLSQVLAGLIGSLTLIGALVGSPLAGKLYDKSSPHTRVILVSGLTCALALGLYATNSVYGAAISTILTGLAVGFQQLVVFSAARGLVAGIRQYEVLAQGWVNVVSILASFWFPQVFSALVLSSGYSVAWMAAAVFSLVLSFSILTLKRYRVIRTDPPASD